MPFPSIGCQTCKTRRIKCDGTQPVCRRCIKAQRTCQGMRSSQASAIIHIENPFASGLRKRPRGPRPVPAVELAGRQATLWQLPSTDLKTLAVTCYLHSHLQTLKEAPGVVKTFSDDFLPIWMSKAEPQILDLALSSIALAVFSRTRHHPPAAVEASTKYHQLLQMAQMKIPSMDGRNIDECLLTIFFMSRYEDTIHRPSRPNPKALFTRTLHSISHHDGALAILEAWRNHLSHAQPATDIIKHTRRSMLKSALMRNLALPNWILDGSAFGEFGLELEFDLISVRVVKLRHRVSKFRQQGDDLKRKPHCPGAVIDDLDREAQDIDEALQVWASHFPKSWSYQRHDISEFPSRPMRYFPSQVVYSYPNPACAAVWSHYYATRMLVNNTRLRILETIYSSLEEAADGRPLECLYYVEAMANDFMSSLPFCLQTFKVMGEPQAPTQPNAIVLNTEEEVEPYVISLAVWPLTIAGSIKDVNANQQRFFRSELARIGRRIGVGVLECAESEQWLEV